MTTRRMLTVGLLLVMSGLAGCSSPTTGTTGAAQDDVAVAGPQPPATAEDLGGQPAPPPIYPPTQLCTSAIADNAWTGSIGPNGYPTSQSYVSSIDVAVGSNCTQVTWLSTSVTPASGGGVLSSGSCFPSCLANPMTSQKIPSGKKDQAVLFYAGAVGTTVFQVQDSTGTLGGTYTVNVVAQ